MNLLILYPVEFKSYSKFSRKLDSILADAMLRNVIFPLDCNGFIHDYFSAMNSHVSLIGCKEWKDISITHAIVFDDGEVFPDEVLDLKEAGVFVRRIKVSITRVINIKRDISYSNLRSTKEYEYIGRGSYWGNPYSMLDGGASREDVISKFKYDFDRDLFPNKKKSEVYKLAGKRLGCFCKPEACHGDILADFLNSWDDGK